MMRTTIVIDDRLIRDTLRATGLKNKREAWNWDCGHYFG